MHLMFRSISLENVVSEEINMLTGSIYTQNCWEQHVIVYLS